MNETQTKTIIGEDVEITGNIKCESNIQIDGKLNGDLTCNGNAVIGTTSAVKGNLSVETISILGQVNGNVVAKDKIELKSTARLNGDIRARRLTVEDGVTFVGKAEVNPAGAQGGRNAQQQGQQQAEARATAERPEADAAEDETDTKSGIFKRR